MAVQHLVVVALCVLLSYGFANPDDELTINLDVNVNSDNRQHKHTSFVIPSGRFLKQKENTSKLYQNVMFQILQWHSYYLLICVKISNFDTFLYKDEPVSKVSLPTLSAGSRADFLPSLMDQRGEKCRACDTDSSGK